MARFHLPPVFWSGEACLTGDEARHFSQVLRGRKGDVITVFDGAGRRADARVKEVARDRVALELGETRFTPPIPPALTLAVAIPKGKTMDLIVQKAVELGVRTIQPLVTRRTIVQPGEGKAEKWRRVALEACKQCGTDFLPEVAEPAEFAQWLGTAGEGLRLIASLADSALGMRDAVRAESGVISATVLIGPEGDFTPEETASALMAGFVPVTLGSTILRVETAALFCLSALKYEFS